MYRSVKLTIWLITTNLCGFWLESVTQKTLSVIIALMPCFFGKFATDVLCRLPTIWTNSSTLLRFKNNGSLETIKFYNFDHIMMKKSNFHFHSVFLLEILFFDILIIVITLVYRHLFRPVPAYRMPFTSSARVQPQFPFEISLISYWHLVDLNSQKTSSAVFLTN